MPDSLQVAVGSAVTLTWKATNAPDGFELTDPAQNTPQEFAATVTSADVTASAASQDYSLVAISGSARSAPSTVHVSTHADAVVSSHSYVTHPDAPAAGIGKSVVITSLDLQKKLEWPTSPSAHLKISGTIDATGQLVFTPASAGATAPDKDAALEAASQGIEDYVTATLEAPLVSALEDPSSFSMTSDGMTQAQLFQQSRNKGESSYTFLQVTLYQVNFSVPALQTAPFSIALTLAAATVSLSQPLDSGLGVLTGSATLTLFDASAGLKNIAGGNGLALQGALSLQVNLTLTAVTALDLLKKASLAIGEDVLLDSAVTFSDVAGTITVDGAVACASAAGAIALVAFVGYEVGKSFNMLVKADKDFDFGILLKNDDTYVPGVMADVRKQLDSGCTMGLLGGTILPALGEVTVQGGKLGTDTRLKMQEALRARNPNLAPDRFETLFTAYMQTNESAIAGALDKQLKELTEVFSWMQIVRNGMPLSLPSDAVDAAYGPVPHVWAVVWKEVFGESIDTLMDYVTDELWKKDSNPNISGTVAGQDKWKLLQASYVWKKEND